MGSIYLIRHGQASFGADDYDVLSPVGVEQAQVLGRHLADLGIAFDRCIAGDLRLWDWIRSVMNGQTLRADGTITLLDEMRQPVMAFRFRRAWPCKWQGPTLDATSNEIAIETLELCHEGLDVE